MNKCLSIAASAAIMLSVAGCNGTDGTNGVNGKDGVAGKAGTNGVNGKDGVAGTNGVNGTNGKDGSNATALQNNVSVPTTDAEKAKIRVATGINVDFAEKPLSYKTRDIS